MDRAHVRRRAKRVGQGEVVLIPPPGGGPDFLGAIAFLAVLAYPNRSEIAKRDRFVHTAKSHLLKCWIRSGGDPARIHARYRLAAWRRIYARRYPAAVMADALLFSEAAPSARASIAGHRVKSVNTAAAGVVRLRNARDDRKDQDLANVKRLIWSESKPVLHLALAFHHELQGWTGKISVFRLLNDPAWASKAITRSELLLPLLACVPSLRNDDFAVRLKYQG